MSAHGAGRHSFSAIRSGQITPSALREFSKNGLFDELMRALAERNLNAALDDHLETGAASAALARKKFH